MRLTVWRLGALAAVWLGLAAAAAPPDFSGYQPKAEATAIAAGQAPAIDGDLSDPIWQKAKPIDRFYQVDPREGAPATERTELRILYDSNTLYIAIMAFDSEPDKIVATVKNRDGDVFYNDYVRIYLDPGRTRRDAYVFGVTAAGARYDALLKNNDSQIVAWNTIWSAKTKITADGWTAEIAIPFRSIAYGSNPDWGMDIWRTIRRKSEYVRWSSINRMLGNNDISQEGTLSGFKGIEGGSGLDLQAFALSRYDGNWRGERDSGVSFRPSGNLFYKLTPSLTGTLTANTDFSDAPLDSRQVNTSRFSLFYPERRDFFLQDAAAFEFGGEPINDDDNAMPFLSRRIGIIDNHAVNILSGAKISGEYRRLGIGALSVRTAGSHGVGEQQLSVLRATAPIGDESKAGFIFTNGSPTGASANSVFGADFQLRHSHLFGNKIVRLDGYYERSFDSKHGDGDSFGAKLLFPNEPWSAGLFVKQVGAHFHPALGYVSWNGIRSYDAWGQYTWRFDRAALRSAFVKIFLNGTTGLDNDFETYHPGLRIGFTGAADDSVNLRYARDHDVVHAAYSLPHDIVIPAGTYDWDNYYGYINTSTARPVYLWFEARYQDGYYGGHMLSTYTQLTARLNASLSFDIEHSMKMISVPKGDVAIHIGMFDAAWTFSPDMQLRAQAQYDNISKDFELSLRFGWEFEPGSELLIVLGEDALLNDGYRSQSTTFSVRLGKTFRF